MRILVTGAAGFLGSHLCDRLLAEGHAVVAMDNFITGNPRNIAHLKDDRRFHFVEHNVTKFISVEGEIDAVLHFALGTELGHAQSFVYDLGCDHQFSRLPFGQPARLVEVTIRRAAGVHVAGRILRRQPREGCAFAGSGHE